MLGRFLRNRKIILAVAIFLPIGLAGLFYYLRGNDKADTSVAERIRVQVLTLKPEMVSNNIVALGKLEYTEKVEIVPLTPGIIRKIFVREGQRVRVGQALVQMDDFQLKIERAKVRTQIDSAASELRLARENHLKAREEVEIRLFSREQKNINLKKAYSEMTLARDTHTGKEVLHKEGSITRRELATVATARINAEATYLNSKKQLEISGVGFRDADIRSRGLKVPSDKTARRRLLIEINTRITKQKIALAKSAMRRAKAERSRINDMLRAATIRSPVNGEIAIKNKNVGEFVNQGAAGSPEQAVLVIVVVSKLFATVDLRVKDGLYVRKMIKTGKGLRMKLLLDDYKELKPEPSGRIIVASPLLDSATQTMKIKALINNSKGVLAAGASFKGVIERKELIPVLLSPRTAIHNSKNESGEVFVFENGQARTKKISIGPGYGKLVQISGEVNPQDVLIISSVSRLRNGTPVTPIYAKGKTQKKTK